MRLTARSWKRSSLERITVKLEDEVDGVRERELVIADRERGERLMVVVKRNRRLEEISWCGKCSNSVTKRANSGPRQRPHPFTFTEDADTASNLCRGSVRQKNTHRVLNITTGRANVTGITDRAAEVMWCNCVLDVMSTLTHEFDVISVALFFNAHCYSFAGNVLVLENDAQEQSSYFKVYAKLNKTFSHD